MALVVALELVLRRAFLERALWRIAMLSPFVGDDDARAMARIATEKVARRPLWYFVAAYDHNFADCQGAN